MAGRHFAPCHAPSASVNVTLLSARSAYHGTEVPRSRLCSDGASTSGSHAPQDRAWPSTQQRSCVRCSVAAPGREQEAIQLEVAPADPSASSAVASQSLLCDPESFALDSGQLSVVHQEASQRPEDVFRCSGCSLKDCQVHKTLYAQQCLCYLPCTTQRTMSPLSLPCSGSNWMCTNVMAKLSRWLLAANLERTSIRCCGDSLACPFCCAPAIMLAST